MNATAPLLDTLRAEGYLPGTPPTVKPATLRLDARIARAARCAACNYRGLTLAPFHQGDVYRAVGVCDRCKAQVEL